MKCKTALQVGVDTYISKSGSKLAYTYRHVKQDADGWVKPEEWLPISFDLVILKLEVGTKMGWFTGDRWDGRKVNPEDEVIAWKRSLEEE